VVFLVPTGRGQATDLISAEEFEQVFEKLHSTSQVFCLTSRAPKRSTAAISAAAKDGGTPPGTAFRITRISCPEVCEETGGQDDA